MIRRDIILRWFLKLTPVIFVSSSEVRRAGVRKRGYLSQRHRAHREEKIDLQRQKTEKVSSVIFVGSSEVRRAGVKKKMSHTEAQSTQRRED